MKRGRWIIYLMLLSSLLMLMLLWFGPSPEETQSNMYPRRVVTLSAGLTETVFATGGGDRIVGISRWTQYPPPVGFIPRCGDILEPDFDRILALEPDLLMLPDVSDNLKNFAKAHDIPVATYSLDSPQDVLKNIMLIGQELGNVPQAISLADRIKIDLERIRSSIPDGARPRTALVLHRQKGEAESIAVAGGGGYLDKMLAMVGAENVFSEYAAFADVSYQDLERHDPDVILVWQPGMSMSQGNTVLQQWGARGTLRAVRNGKIQILDDEDLMIPGPRFTLAAYSLLRAIYGESVLIKE